LAAPPGHSVLHDVFQYPLLHMHVLPPFLVPKKHSVN
jgi:hypothetical protein